MTASIHIATTPAVQYVLRLADTCLISGQRLAEWSGHGPVLEEDIALSNMALDLVGQARALLTLVGELEGAGHDEDQLAFLRDERDFVNPTLVELPRGDFAFTVVRNAIASTLLKQLWIRLQASTDSELAGIAGKAVKEARYHQRHAADWVARLGDGTGESRRRVERALRDLWLYVPELFEVDAVDEAAVASGLGPRWADVQDAWNAEIQQILAAGKLEAPATGAFRSSGKRGLHSEHMGYILAEMQQMQRTFPGGIW